MSGCLRQRIVFVPSFKVCNMTANGGEYVSCFIFNLLTRLLLMRQMSWLAFISWHKCFQADQS